MTKTYAQMMEEIEALQREAEAVRQQEVAGVIARIKEAIAFYGLTADDLGFGRARNAIATRAGTAANRAARRGSPAKAGGQPKYRDEHGNVWSGRGPRPKWFKEALAAGRQPDEFAA